MRLGKQVRAVRSDWTFQLTPLLVFQPCFRLLLLADAISSPRLDLAQGALQRDLLPLSLSDTRFPSAELGFTLLGNTPGNSKPLFLLPVPNLTKQAIFPWESRGCVTGNSDLFQITHWQHSTLCITVRCKTLHPTLAWLELSPKHYTWCDQEK